MYHCLYSLSNRVIIIFENTLKILHISRKLSFVIVSCVYIYRKLLKFYSAKAVYHMLHQSCLTMHWRKASEHNKIPNLKKSYDCYQLKLDLNSMPNCKNKKQKKFMFKSVSCKRRLGLYTGALLPLTLLLLHP